MSRLEVRSDEEEDQIYEILKRMLVLYEEYSDKKHAILTADDIARVLNGTREENDDSY